MTATGAHRRRLVVVLVITCAVLIAEVIGGLIAGSLALLAEAGHVLTDSTGLVLALIAASLATRAATEKRTFGLQRAEVLAALGNALLLVGVAVWVLIMAVDRLRSNSVEIRQQAHARRGDRRCARQSGQPAGAPTDTGQEPQYARCLR